MKQLDYLIESFRLKYEQFFIGCDALEDTGSWNKEVYGEMEAFYQNDLVVFVLRLIAADGKITSEEADYLNRAFGFDYSVDELLEVYNSCREDFEGSFEEQAKSGYELMKRMSEKIAAAYLELLGLICDIIMESDGVVAPAELEEIRKIKALFC